MLGVRLQPVDMKRNIEIYIIYTHWDEYIRDVANKSNISNRRRRSAWLLIGILFIRKNG